MAPQINQSSPRSPKLLDRVREANRLRHGSRSTERSYVGWIRRFILFHGKRHPAEMGAPEVAQFLSSLAVEGRVAASTQNHALQADHDDLHPRPQRGPSGVTSPADRVLDPGSP
jgi:hypothetical protein